MEELVDSLIEQTLKELEMRKKEVFRPSFPQEYRSLVRDHEMIAFKQLGSVDKESNHSFQVLYVIVSLAILALVLTYTSKQRSNQMKTVTSSNVK